MVVELDDTSKVKDLFAGWQETLIYSCVQKVMGKIYVTDPDEPVSAFAYVGCFGFVAGEPNRELLENKPEGFAIITPQNEAWASLIEEVYTNVRKVTRYAIKKDHINHPILGTWGGHCGYSVRPSERGKGYAIEMLRLNVKNAKKRGIEKMLVTCDSDNTASEKTILANSGVFESTINVDGTEMKRYWINVSE